ncbi:MAG: hypothetical protein RLZZ511_1335 [Cyanobacteriota bacterium]
MMLRSLYASSISHRLIEMYEKLHSQATIANCPTTCCPCDQHWGIDGDLDYAGVDRADDCASRWNLDGDLSQSLAALG